MPKSKTLEECLEFYRNDSDFRVSKIREDVWNMRGIIISFKTQDRAIYDGHVNEIMMLGKFKSFHITTGSTGATQLWCYNRMGW